MLLSSGLPFCTSKLPFLLSLTWNLPAHPSALRLSSASHPRVGGGPGRSGMERPPLPTPTCKPAALTQSSWSSEGGASHVCSGSQPVPFLPTSPPGWIQQHMGACPLMGHLGESHLPLPTETLSSTQLLFLAQRLRTMWAHSIPTPSPPPPVTVLSTSVWSLSPPLCPLWRATGSFHVARSCGHCSSWLLNSR